MNMCKLEGEMPDNSKREIYSSVIFCSVSLPLGFLNSYFVVVTESTQGTLTSVEHKLASFKRALSLRVFLKRLKQCDESYKRVHERTLGRK